jgi:hypothetical protein
VEQTVEVGRNDKDGRCGEGGILVADVCEARTGKRSSPTVQAMARPIARLWMRRAHSGRPPTLRRMKTHRREPGKAAAFRGGATLVLFSGRKLDRTRRTDADGGAIFGQPQERSQKRKPSGRYVAVRQRAIAK